MAGLMEKLTSERNALSADIAGIKSSIQNQFIAAAESQAKRVMEERQRVAALKRQVQQEQAKVFAGQQANVRESISSQIDTLLANLKLLQQELTRLSEDEATRVTALRVEPRRDLLSQTLALHGLFLNGQEGGAFALGAYLVLALLFMLVDTIPIIVKFFSKHGPYDNLVDCDEARSDRRHDSNISKESALTSGALGNRAGKEFLEHLLSLEQEFQKKVAKERKELLSSGDEKAAERIKILDELSDSFSRDLKAQKDRFFALRARSEDED